MTLRVLQPGMLTTVQDRGRWGYQRYGVPVAGAMDPWAMRIANILVGNPEDAAALELTLTGPELVFGRESLIALAGADLSARIDGRPVPPWHTALAPAGSTLSFAGAEVGARSYLAVSGGIDVPQVLGSRATHMAARLGGLAGRALARGDELRLGIAPPAAERLRHVMGARLLSTWSAGQTLRTAAGAGTATVRLTPGAHLDRLAGESRARLFGDSFRVSSQSDRMGYRLECRPLVLDDTSEILSGGVAFGTLQLPQGGTPILLMADRQTTGGYPRLGEVASIDFPTLAQLRPGDAVRFREVTVREAQALYLARETDIAQFHRGLTLV